MASKSKKNVTRQTNQNAPREESASLADVMSSLKQTSDKLTELQAAVAKNSQVTVIGGDPSRYAYSDS